MSAVLLLILDTEGGLAPQSINPARIESTETIYAPTITVAGTQTINPARIESTSVVYSLMTFAGGIGFPMTRIESTAQVWAPSFASVYNVFYGTAGDTEPPRVPLDTPRYARRYARRLRGQPANRNVYRLTDGTVTDVDPDSWGDVAHVWWGGHRAILTDDEVTELTAAGYDGEIVQEPR